MSDDANPPKKKLLAVASGGGHWVQLMRLKPVFAGFDCAFATTLKGYREEVSDARFYAVVDGNRWSKWRLMISAVQVCWVVLKERPHVVISTGAAPGLLAIGLGKLMGSRTVWVDSIANAEKLSMSGRIAVKHASLCLTQWPHLAKPDGPTFLGAVL